MEIRHRTGLSSPIVWIDRIFLTEHDKATRTFTAICIERKNGKALWRRSVTADHSFVFRPGDMGLVQAAILGGAGGKQRERRRRKKSKRKVGVQRVVGRPPTRDWPFVVYSIPGMIASKCLNGF